MTALIEVPWRIYPAIVVVVAGLSLAIWAVRRAITDARHARRDPLRAYVIVRGFRLAIVGVCLAGIGAGWWWSAPWLIGLSAIIGGEELLESSTFIAALRRDIKQRRADAGHAVKTPA